MLAEAITHISDPSRVMASLSLFRLVLAIPFVLIWVGVGHWVAVKAMGSVSNRLEVAVLSGAIAIAAVILHGVALNALGALSASGWAVSTALVGLVLFARARFSDLEYSWPRLPRLEWRQVCALAVSCLLVTVAIVTARVGVDHHRQFMFTEFWLLPAATNQQFILGFTNREQKAVTYSVEISADGRLIDSWKNIRIADGETWTSLWSSPVAGEAQLIEAILVPTEDKTIGPRRVRIDRSDWAANSASPVQRGAP